MARTIPLLTDEAITLISRRFAVLSEPMRLRLLHRLMSGEMSVNALVDAIGGTQANISRHLQTLADAGLVSRRKEGLQVFYAVADHSIFDLCQLVCGSLEQQMNKHASALRPAARTRSAGIR